MEITEIMINDLVSHNREVYKVSGILGNAQMAQLFPIKAKNKDGLFHLPCNVYIGEITSIPLTEDILKANGFVYDEIADSWYNDRIDNLYEDKNGYYKYVDGYEIRFDSVHKFQQYLRICGLNDFADNFKIE